MEPYQKRLKRLSRFLSENGCDALIVDDQINLYYLTGLNISSGKLIVHLKGAHLAVDSRYYELCKKTSPYPILLAEGHRPLSSLLFAAQKTPLKCLAFNSANTTYGAFLQLQKDITSHNSRSEHPLQLKPIENPFSKIRSIKDKEEIDTLREAAKLGSEGFDFVVSLLKEGISEREVAVELEIFWKKRGGKAVAFDPIIAFGSNSSMPHYRVGKEKLQKGKSVLIDIGVNYEHYHSDMTRVVYFGEPDPKLLAIHQIVQKAQLLALNLCKPGTLIGKLDEVARNFIQEQGYGEHFTHSLGHGVGLEIHEYPTVRNNPPFSETPLEEGMVITIEPGIYLPGIGGVRIEDTVVITKEGYENLTLRPKDPKLL